ncbi:MAG: ABC transporter ATP-binding protein [Alphaproteobacteria bacterium]
MSDTPLLQLTNVTRSFTEGSGKSLDVLRGIDLAVMPGEIVGLVGHSGAGKSTMLQICGLLEPPTSGTVKLMGEDAANLSEAARASLRAKRMGFVYQYHHLLPEFSALENLLIPQYIHGRSKTEAMERAKELLTIVGLMPRAEHRPAELSGGEQQRVAIARALANGPKLLLADEPTGNLDEGRGQAIFELLKVVVKEGRIGALIATHNLALARQMDRVVELKDGKLHELSPQDLAA